MSTVSKAIADEVIAGNGMYPGDHIRVVKVVKSKNAFDGSPAYGLIYEGQPLDMYNKSQWIIDPVVIWEYKK